MVGDGDQEAFSELYNRLRRPVFDHILNKYGSTLSKEDAEDIVHTTFTIVQSKSHTFRGLNNDFSARGWIYKIARSQASKMLKVYKRTSISLDDDSDDGFAAPERSSRWSDINWEGEESVEERAINRSFLQKIFSAGILSNEEWEIIELRYKKGYTFEQIGSHYGKTKPRAKQRHDGILAKIRRALGLYDQS
jgi:RNA polymerase sigma factor (sigma-70 family)